MWCSSSPMFIGGWVADHLITKKIFSVTCTWRVLKGTSMEVQVIGAQFSYKFVMSPIHKRKARAVSLCMKLHVGMPQVKVYQTYKLHTAWGINLLLHLSQVWLFLFNCIVFGDLHVAQNGAIMEVLGLFAEAWFAKHVMCVIMQGCASHMMSPCPRKFYNFVSLWYHVVPLEMGLTYMQGF